MTNTGPITVRQTGSWFDIATTSERFDGLVDFFERHQRHPCVLRNVPAHTLRPYRFLTTAPMEVTRFTEIDQASTEGTTFLIAGFAEQDPSHISLFAAQAKPANGVSRFFQRFGSPGLEFPNPRKLNLVHVGDIHPINVEPLPIPDKVPPQRPELNRFRIEGIVESFELEAKVAGTHEFQRKLDVVITRPANIAMIGIGAAITLTVAPIPDLQFPPLPTLPPGIYKPTLS